MKPLFDIAHKEAEQMLKIDEDKQFLTDALELLVAT